MKPAEQSLSETRRQHAEVVVARCMYELFRRLPMVCGFWLRTDLQVAGVSLFRGYAGSATLYEQITQSVVDLADEHPDAVPLMRGRTFARALH